MAATVIIALALCLLEITVIMTASPLAKPSLILGFLPEDVRLAAKGHPEPPKWKQGAAYLLFAVFFAAMIGSILYLGIDGLRKGYGFWKLTLRFLVLLCINKVFDILVQDQWLVMTIGYYKKLFPETAQCEGWKDRSFNKKNQLVRLAAYPFLCMLTAGIFLLFR